MKFQIGDRYRRSTVHDDLGGSRQSGISVSAKTDNIFAFTGETGDLYGYSDGWESGVFHYTGEGQVGDMQFVRGNRAIRDHHANGKHLHLFEMEDKGFVRYLGEMSCVDYYYFDAPDRDGLNRRAIKFVFQPVSDTAVNSLSDVIADVPYRKPDQTSRRGLITSRVGQGWYRQGLLRKFGRKCAVTECELEEILIASHIVPWRDATDAERLDLENGILLCPNYDALFDRHLISFSDEGQLLVGPSLSLETAKPLGINRAACISVTDEMKPYLARHRALLR